MKNMPKEKTEIKFEVTHAKKEESGLTIVLSESGKLYVLGQPKPPKKGEKGEKEGNKGNGESKDRKSIATELGVEWFDGINFHYESYKESIIKNSDPNLVKEVNASHFYQNQLWELLSETVRINESQSQPLYPDITKESEVSSSRDVNQKRNRNTKRSNKKPWVNLDFEVESIN